MVSAPAATPDRPHSPLLVPAQRNPERYEDIDHRVHDSVEDGSILLAFNPSVVLLDDQGYTGFCKVSSCFSEKPPPKPVDFDWCKTATAPVEMNRQFQFPTCAGRVSADIVQSVPEERALRDRPAEGKEAPAVEFHAPRLRFLLSI